MSKFIFRTSSFLAVCVFLLASFLSLGTAFGQSNLQSLVTDINSGSQGDIEFALVGIAKLGPDASTAIDAICRRLGSTSFSVRSLASEALVGIGPEAVPAVRKLLGNESPLIRAAVLQTLGRLNAITLKELEAFANSEDPRIKTAVAVTIRNGQFADSGDAVGKLLVVLLADRDPLVVVQACLALQKCRVTPELAIPALVREMTRKRLQEVLMHTLSRYGTEANSALPYLLEGNFDSFISDGQLERIGPPGPADVEKLFSLIEKRDFEQINRVADAIGRMGTAGSAHADRLAELAIQFTDEAVLHKKKYDAASEEAIDEELEQFDDFELFWAANNCAVASWNVSHDAKRFVGLFERIQIGFDGGIYFPNNLQNDNPWNQFSASDAKEISHWLESEDEVLNVQAFIAIRHIGANAHPHVDKLIELLAEEKFRDQVIGALADIGAKGADKVLPVLVEAVKAKTIGAKELGIYVSKVRVSSPESDVILKRGLLLPKSTNECAQALCKSARESEEGEVFRLVIEAAEGRGEIAGLFGGGKRIAKDNAIRELAILKNVPKSALGFVQANLDYSRYKNPNAVAFKLLGNIGPDAKDSVEKIRLRLDYRDVDVRINSAVALFQIVDDRATLEQLLVDEMKNPDNRSWGRLKLVEAIVQLGDEGLSFRKFIWDNEQYFIDECVVEYCEVLKTIGDERSLASLKRIAGSKDWVGQQAASKVLRLIETENKEVGK